MGDLCRLRVVLRPPDLIWVSPLGPSPQTVQSTIEPGLTRILPPRQTSCEVLLGQTLRPPTEAVRRRGAPPVLLLLSSSSSSSSSSSRAPPVEDKSRSCYSDCLDEFCFKDELWASAGPGSGPEPSAVPQQTRTLTRTLTRVSVAALLFEDTLRNRTL
ncbi:Hypothetical predicted protein [Xyrichtys novacula]|uniref:Uncharacterized protein n=1 Tax=Xyrichtys novacula TaxID=13765 RepID=A0AAV1FV50_XYRNO|nr:Hypothetical predicted protein [Xyrichtys novacula]